MAKKQNPILAAFEAKKEVEFSKRLATNTEINLIAMLIAGNNLGIIAEKRAHPFLAEQIEVKMQIAEAILEDSKSDKSLEYTKADLAGAVKQILGPEGWESCKYLFPLLGDYWNE